ncbi:hypothetical protein BH24GEM3_BH24GEM3_25420 [soil metagenome]|jgi:hypothetical protein|nr:hypothetical protein [Gemmatimonadota bacterium]
MAHAPATDPMRKAFATRLHEVVDHLAESADSATVEEVLAMADAFSGLGVAMQRVATLDAAAVRDPLAAARVRGIAARKRLIERAGGLLRLSEAAERLGVTPQAVTGRRARETILAVPMPNGEWVYPACQFTDHGLVSDLDGFLRAFRDADPWTRLAVLLAPSSRYGGRSALDLLLEGSPAEARSIAATYGEQG